MTSIAPSEFITILTETHQRVLTAFSHPAATLAQSYAPGKWTGHQLLIHLADVESAFLDRFRRGLADAKPLYWALDPDRWTARLATANRDLTLAKELFDVSRRSNLDLLATITSEELNRSGVHSDYGTMTVKDLLIRCGWHSTHHLSQINAIVQGTPWVKPV